MIVWRMSELPYSAAEVGKRVALLISASGMKQSEFADALGLSRQEVNAWVNGNLRPSFAKAQVILREYPVTADWLYYGDPQRMSVEMARKLFGRVPETP